MIDTDVAMCTKFCATIHICQWTPRNYCVHAHWSCAPTSAVVPNNCNHVIKRVTLKQELYHCKAASWKESHSHMHACSWPWPTYSMYSFGYTELVRPSWLAGYMAVPENMLRHALTFILARFWASFLFVDGLTPLSDKDLVDSSCLSQSTSFLLANEVESLSCFVFINPSLTSLLGLFSGETNCCFFLLRGAGTGPVMSAADFFSIIGEPPRRAG